MKREARVESVRRSYTAIIIERSVCSACGVCDKRCHELESSDLRGVAGFFDDFQVREKKSSWLCSHCDGEGGHIR